MNPTVFIGGDLSSNRAGLMCFVLVFAVVVENRASYEQSVEGLFLVHVPGHSITAF